jgi:hypothetical protein
VARTKTKLAGTTTVLSQSYAAGTLFTLGHADVITSSINGANGQLDGAYEVIDNGLDDPEFYRNPVIKLIRAVDFTGHNTITYNYYEHGANGDFFSVNSYGDYTLANPTIEYDLIPNYQGQSLANFIDFRCKEDYTDARSGSTNKGAAALVPNRVASIDYSYYLPRKDRIIINADGEILPVTGVPAKFPVLPPEPENCLTLYTYFVPAWTGSAKEINANYINNQRQTMKDLGRLKKRVETVEYYSALSVLENSALQQNLLNSDGTQRFKNGILVDNFRRDKTANPIDRNFLAATDRTKGELRPFYNSNNFRLFYRYPTENVPDTNKSSADDYEENSTDTLIDYYNSNSDNNYKIDKNTSQSLPKSGRPQTLSVTGFQTGDEDNAETNGVYQLYLINNRGFPEYRRVSSDVELSKSSRRIFNDVKFEYYKDGPPIILENGTYGQPMKATKTYRWEIQTRKADGTGYETQYYIDTDGTAGNEAPFPTKITANWLDLNRAPQSSAKIENLLDDLTEGYLPESTSAQDRDRFILDGTNNGDVLSLWNGQKEILFDQPNASRTISVQPYELTRFEGLVKLSPDGDEWVDTTRLPASVVQDNSLFQMIEFFQNNTTLLDDQIGMFWNHWETLSQGTEVLSDVTISGNFNGGNRQRTTITETTSEQARDGIQRSLELAETIEESQGDKVVDINIVPFIRSRDISVYATGLKPNTRIYAFFDDKDVSRYVAATDSFKKYGHTEHVNEYNGQGAPNSKVAGGPFQSTNQNAYDVPLYTTAETGEFFGTFRIPNNNDMRFRTGLRKFKLTSSKSNKDIDADTIASTTYSAYGLRQSVEETIISTRIPEIVETQHTEQRTIISQNTEVREWTSDPVAQTFTIPETYPNGVSVTDVDVFFAEKPNFPVNVQVYIVPTEQGLPTNRVVPGSRVSLPSVKVNVPPNGRDETDGARILPTNFKFDYPVYLKSGAEYAIVVFSPSPLYRVWVSELGGANVVNSQRPITKNSNIGVLLKSQNAKTWTADQTKDLMFRMNKGVFLTSRAFEFHTTSSGSNGNNKQNIGVDRGSGFRNVKISALNIASESLELPQTEIRYEIRFEDNIGQLTNSEFGVPPSMQAKQTYELKKEIDTISQNITDIVLTGVLTSKNRGDGFSDITPIIDLNKHSLLTFQNHVETRPTTTFSNGEYNTLTSARNNIRGYVTKNVKLTNPANNLRILMATNRLSDDGDLEVYTKARRVSDNCPWDNKNWELTKLVSVLGDEVSSNGSTFSPSLAINTVSTEFSDAEYNFSPTTDFTEYAVKIAFTGSGDSAKIVRVKDLRVIATS